MNRAFEKESLAPARSMLWNQPLEIGHIYNLSYKKKVFFYNIKYYIYIYIIIIAARRCKNRKLFFLVPPAYIPGSAAFLENNRIEGTEAIQSCKLIETEIGKRDTNGEE